MLASLRESLCEVLPDFGRHLGFDGKVVDSHSTGQKDRETSKTSDPEADWVQHTTQATYKMKLRVGLAFAVMLAMALGHIQQGRAHQMRSLVQTPRPASG